MESLFHVGRLVDVNGTAPVAHEVFKPAAGRRLPFELLVILEELEESTGLLIFGEVIKRALRNDCY